MHYSETQGGPRCIREEASNVAVAYIEHMMDLSVDGRLCYSIVFTNAGVIKKRFFGNDLNSLIGTACAYHRITA